MLQNFPKISHGTPCNTSSSPATSIRSIHSPIITLLALEKGQLVSRWRHFRMEKAQSESKLNCKLTCAVDQLCLFMFRTNKRTTKKKKRKGERSGNWTWRQTRFCFVHWIYASNEGNVLLCLPNCIIDISDLPLQVVKNISSKLSSTLLLSKSR